MPAQAVRTVVLASLLALGACTGAPQAEVPAGPVTVQIFSDPQCFACRRFYLQNLKPAMAELGSKGIKVEHHLLPLRRHQFAREASALIVAGEQLGAGGRERVLGALFETQPRWEESGNLAGAVAPFFSPAERAVLQRGAAPGTVAADLARARGLAKQSGVEGLPAIFVLSGGERHRIPSTVQYPIFRRYLNSRLEP